MKTGRVVLLDDERKSFPMVDSARGLRRSLEVPLLLVAPEAPRPVVGTRLGRAGLPAAVLSPSFGSHDVDSFPPFKTSNSGAVAAGLWT